MRLFYATLAMALFTGGLLRAEPVIGYSGNQIFAFDSATPGTITSTINVTGFNVGDALIGIDYRPFDGTLVGIGYNAATGNGRVYAINLYSGTASPLTAAVIPFGTGVTGFGVDFNPTAGPSNALRIISNGAAPNNNFRLPGGAMASVISDPALNPGTPNVVATAYTNNTAAPVVGPTTMYTITDAGGGVFNLNTQGGINSVPSPNTGTQNLVATISGLAAGDIVNGLDVSGATGVAFLSTQNGLYSLNLISGVATPLGNFGGGFAGNAGGISVVPANGNPTPAPAAILLAAAGFATITGIARRRRNA